MGRVGCLEFRGGFTFRSGIRKDSSGIEEDLCLRFVLSDLFFF